MLKRLRINRVLFGFLVFGFVLTGEPITGYWESGNTGFVLAQKPPSPSPTKSPSPAAAPPNTNTLLQESNNLQKQLNNLQKESNNLQKGSSFWLGWIALSLTGLGIIHLVFQFINHKKINDQFSEFLEEIKKIKGSLKSLDEIKTTTETMRERQEKLGNLPEKLGNIEKDLRELKEAQRRYDQRQQEVYDLLKKIEQNIPLFINKLMKQDLWIVSENQDKREQNDNLPSVTETIETYQESNPLEGMLTSEEQNIVDNYNQRRDLGQWITEVTTTQKSIYQARGGIDNLPTLSIDYQGTGMYWIITEKEGSYLVPNHHRTFNSHQMNSLQNLFECRGYREEMTDKSRFTLIKPAKVSVVSSGETWKLDNEGKGILDFRE